MPASGSVVVTADRRTSAATSSGPPAGAALLIQLGVDVGQPLPHLGQLGAHGRDVGRRAFPHGAEVRAVRVAQPRHLRGVSFLRGVQVGAVVTAVDRDVPHKPA
ncbi:hypothetical protein [Saccharothrix australiensis]|uniref:hypothetical protein n=1 Tax=Saccharothrix australiensis TaxID=2072 RepID=UPI0011C3B7F0|nr:hypothetical protein [Saccharothrix australiensis]